MGQNLKTNTVLNTIKTLVSIIFPIITFPYVSRILLPDNIGKVNFAISYINYFILIASLGISTYAIRKCAAKKDDKEELSNIASQLYSINVIMSIIAYIALFLTLFFCERLEHFKTLILIESFTIWGTTIGAEWLNQAMEDFKFITIRYVCFQFLALILILLLVRQQDDYVIYTIILVGTNLGTNITNYFYRKKICKVSFVLKIDWKLHFSPIMYLFVMSLSQIIFNNVDVSMLGLMWNDYQVGIYTTAHKITLIVSSVVQSLALVIIPKLSYYFEKKDYDNINRLLRKVLMFNISLGLPCVMGVWVMSKDIAFLVGGVEYAAAAPVMQILIFSFLFSLVGGSFLGNAILIPSKQEKYYMIVCCITAVVNFVLNLILIPKFASIGAAISTAFNGFLIMFLLFFKVDKNIRINNLTSIFVGPLIGCAVIYLCCKFLSVVDDYWTRVICSILVSLISYTVILVVTKNEFGIEIFQAIKNKLKK